MRRHEDIELMFSPGRGFESLVIKYFVVLYVCNGQPIYFNELTILLQDEIHCGKF